MVFSVGDLFDRALKCAHGLTPDPIEMSAQAGDAFRIQLVEAASSGSAVGHQSRIFQYAQVLGDRGTADWQASRQLIDGQRAAGEPLEDGHAGRIAEGIQSGL
jgi:hypothetical protein